MSAYGQSIKLIKCFGSIPVFSTNFFFKFLEKLIKCFGSIPVFSTNFFFKFLEKIN
jgi:hypothetical protein